MDTGNLALPANQRSRQQSGNYVPLEEESEPPKHQVKPDMQSHKSGKQKLFDYKPKQHRRGVKHHEYDPRAIPADWDRAQQHADARRVARETQGREVKEVCQCCGYEVERDNLRFCGGLKDLGFLGSGLPLLYNFMKYCCIILFMQLCTKGSFDLYVNITGTYCLEAPDPNLAANYQCPLDWMSILSLANSYNRPDLMNIRGYLDMGMVALIMLILPFFRGQQNNLEVVIDKRYITAGDYTILVKNIPTGLNVDYGLELKQRFEQAMPDIQIELTKIILVHDNSEIVQLEKKLDEIVARKKQFLRTHNFNYEDPESQEFNKQIAEMETTILQKELELESDRSKFQGIAMISLLTEKMRKTIIEANPYSFMDQVKCYRAGGLYCDDKTMSWNGQKLFISEAPQPNEIDWSNIHAKTRDKIVGTVKSYIGTGVFLVVLFFVMWGISMWKTNALKQIQAEQEAGADSVVLTIESTIMTSVVSWVIVFFNKFLIGPMLKQFVLMEKIETKTAFNISMAKKVTIALFINTCILVYIIEIIINDNIIGNGGFIQGETAVFVSNAWFTIAVWVIDPWTLQQWYRRFVILHSQEKKLVTQQEANLAMEFTDYSESKRYCDFVKTMWFTFFYGDAIPIGIAINLVCLFIYYWVDKYNVLRRRTIKDNVSSDLSNEMIYWLSFILVLHGIGQISTTYGVYKFVPWQQYFVLGASIVYMFLPVYEWVSLVVPVDGYDDLDPYHDVKMHFETDYDRENPVTRTMALKQWQLYHDELAAKEQS